MEGRESFLSRWEKIIKRRRARWRVKDYADGWIYYVTEKEARASDEAQNGALVERVQ
jgi:hypothetical protein